MNEHLTVLQRHQARLAERRAEIRGRVFAAADGAIVSDAQLGRWLDEIQELSERIGSFHARISEIHAAADLDRLAALRAGSQFSLNDTFESAELKAS